MEVRLQPRKVTAQTAGLKSRFRDWSEVRLQPRQAIVNGVTKTPLPNNTKAQDMKYHHLPHIDVAGYYQFITFRTYDSTDGFIKNLSNQNKPNNKKQLDVDEYLDSSQQGAYLNDGVLLSLSDFFKSNEKVLYELVAFAIMPNHVHLLLKPLDKLSLVMQTIKGVSAKIINEMMGRNGQFWANGYYDKAIRDEKHFGVVYQYIKNNPLKLGDAEASPLRFYGLYDHGSGASAPQSQCQEGRTKVPQDHCRLQD
ncbi:transposase [Candidatus Spongiihabitans sp.]|uniref:transposase n=1 Tax=Candidatus Spongiihabitans sp. TaxID=3101308 RepID=UPI003C6EE55D